MGKLIILILTLFSTELLFSQSDIKYVIDYNLLNDNYFITNDYNGAIKYYTGRIEKDSKNDTCFCQRGIARLLTNNYNAAIADFSSACLINIKNTHAINNRAIAKFFSNDITGSQEDINSVIKIDSMNHFAFYNMGILYPQLWANSMRGLDGCIVKNGSNCVLYFYRGVIWFNKGLFDNAIDDFNQAIVLNPRFSEAYGYRGTAMCNTIYVNTPKGLNSIIKDFDMAIEYNGNANYIQIYLNRGIAFTWKDPFSQVDAKKAINDFDRVIKDSKITKLLGTAYAYRAFANKRLNKFDEARKDLEAAAQYGYDERVVRLYRQKTLSLSLQNQSQRQD